MVLLNVPAVEMVYVRSRYIKNARPVESIRLTFLGSHMQCSYCHLGKKFLKKTSFRRVGMELKKVHKQDRVRKPQEPTPLRNDAGPLSGLQRNAFASLVRFVTKRTTVGMQVHCGWRPERGPASFRSGVGLGFLRLSNPGLVCVLFSAPSLLEMKLFQKLFPHSFCFLGGGF